MKRIILLAILSFSISILVFKLIHSTATNKIRHCPVCQECSLTPGSSTTKCSPRPTISRPEHLEHGMGIAQLGEFKELEEAKKNEKALKEYMINCTKFGNWFCHPDLLNQVSIKKGYYSYFLIIDGLTTPTFMHLCAFMWVNPEMKSWARDKNHNCIEFRQENAEY